ncbi:MAG TPA: DUF4825 domain-containing protein [Neobacillus sp.]|jgi:archaellum component FlaF (FlaF/FlaG flagellin family)
MKSKVNALISALLVATLVLTGCSITTEKKGKQNSSAAENKKNSRYTDYYNAKVQYVGDNSKVINLLSTLKVDDLGEYTIALTTNKEPYGLTINYSKLKENVDENKFKAIGQIDYAFYLLALVENLSFVDLNYKTYNYHLDIEKANKTVNGKIKDYRSSPEKLKELNDKLNPKD